MIRKETTRVIAQFRVEYLHQWLEAPDDVFYLHHPHRHELHIRVELEVTEDREVEFIQLKDLVRQALMIMKGSPGTPPVWILGEHLEDKEAYNKLIRTIQRGEASMEMVAKALAVFLGGIYGFDRDVLVEVLEDGENGAVYERRIGHVTKTTQKGAFFPSRFFRGQRPT